MMHGSLKMLSQAQQSNIVVSRQHLYLVGLSCGPVLIPQHISHVWPSTLERVTSQYTRICTLDPTLNLILKVGLIVCGYKGQLFIDNLVVEGEDAACSNDDTTSLAGITDLNRKRKIQSAEYRLFQASYQCFGNKMKWFQRN